MHILEASILLIALVVVSNIISHYIEALPTALIQISVGLVVALLFKIKIDLEADWFMLLFVAPLLFNDGKRFPKNELWELRAPIFANAIWLVLLTSLVGGFIIAYFIPDIPLPLAISLSAVLSPTDPVAVHGIAEQVKLPKRILSLISGESLINDASGLIAFKYALAAFLTGQFSLLHATADFFYMSIVGAIIGYIMIQVIYRIRMFLGQQGITDVILHTTIQIITPFLIFIVSEEVAHASGVIAVVTAGVLSINRPHIFSGKFSEINLVTNRSWDLVVYLLNGSVFVVLGIELPMAMVETYSNPSINNWLLFGYILLIWFVLLVIRVVWSYSYMWYSSMRKKTKTQPYFYTALLTGLTGVRGSITMATVMSIPLFLPSGEFFQQRSLVIYLACGVIILSLLVATFLLPVLTKQRGRLVLAGDALDKDGQLSSPSVSDSSSYLSENEARIYVLQQAIQFLKEEQSEENELAISNLLHEFTTRLHLVMLDKNDAASNEKYDEIEQKIRIIALSGEQKALDELITEKKITSKAYKKQSDLLAFKYRSQSKGFRTHLKRSLLSSQRQLSRILIRLLPRTSIPLKQKSLLTLEVSRAKGAIRALREYKKSLPKESSIEKNLINQYLATYRNKVERIHSIGKYSKKEYQQQLLEYYMKTLDAERSSIQQLIEDNKISLSLANQLRQSINYTESTLLQDGN